MARIEKDRSDLFDELTALNPRVALRREGDEVVIGRRRDGGTSIYLSQSLVIHLNAEGEFRRAYVDGFLFLACLGRKLRRLTRSRSETTSNLLSHDLTDDQATTLISKIVRHLSLLLLGLERSEFALVKAFPDGVEATAIPNFHKQLEISLHHGIAIADGL
jgi:hypothetical protein